VRIACLNQDPGIAPGRRKGAAVHLLSMRRAFESLGNEVLAVDESDPATARERLERAHAERPLDLVYERHALRATVGASFAREREVPLALEVNAPLAEEEERWRAAPGRPDLDGERLVFSRADLVLAVSHQVARYAFARGARAESLHVFPNGVDLERFRPRPAGDALRSSLVPEGRFALGFHGRLRPWHGFERLVASTRELVDLGLPVHLVLVGEGDFDKDLAGRVPADSVTRVPWVDHDEVGRYVAAFDALPLSYPPDAPCYFSPLKLAEAMACGVVPLVPDLGDLSEAVRDGHDGIVYPARDPAALAQGIRRLIEDPAQAARLARGAVRSAQEKSWERIAAFVLGFVGARARR